MNIIPQQLIGKTIQDCYLSDKFQVIIEFTDGSKIEIQSEKIIISGRMGSYSDEDYIRLQL